MTKTVLVLSKGTDAKAVAFNVATLENAAHRAACLALVESLIADEYAAMAERFIRRARAASAVEDYAMTAAYLAHGESLEMDARFSYGIARSHRDEAERLDALAERMRMKQCG